MPRQRRDYGFRTSVQIPDDVDRVIQRVCAYYKKINPALTPSRSCGIMLIVRAFAKRPNWLEEIGTNDQ